MAVHPVERYLKDLSEIHRTGGGVAVYFREMILPHHPLRWVCSPGACVERISFCRAFGIAHA